MRFIYFFLFACFFPLVCSAQKGRTSIDSLKGQVEQIQRNVNLLKLTNDSLHKELYYFRAKEDFYTLSVDRQGTHFEALMAILLGIAALFSWGYFKIRFDAITKQNRVQKSEIIKLIDNSQKDIRVAKRDLYISIAVVFHNTPLSIEFNLYGQVDFYLSAMKYNVLSLEYTLEDNYLKMTLNNLKNVTANALRACRKFNELPSTEIPKSDASDAIVLITQVEYIKESCLPKMLALNNKKISSLTYSLAPVLDELVKKVKDNKPISEGGGGAVGGVSLVKGNVGPMPKE